MIFVFAVSKNYPHTFSRHIRTPKWIFMRFAVHVNETCAEMLAKCSLCRSPIYGEINVYKWGSNTKNTTSLDTSEPNLEEHVIPNSSRACALEVTSRPATADLYTVSAAACNACCMHAHAQALCSAAECLRVGIYYCMNAWSELEVWNPRKVRQMKHTHFDLYPHFSGK